MLTYLTYLIIFGFPMIAVMVVLTWCDLQGIGDALYFFEKLPI